jgi:tripartite-type tricarboxylate transporter receptor subunit TctC
MRWHMVETPKPIIAKLNWTVVGALGDPAIRSKLASLGHEPLLPDRSMPQRLATFHRAEIEKWRPIIKAANAKRE